MKQKLLSILLLCVMLASTALAQDKRITGRVTSREDGLPLPGVSVKVTGTKTGTQTDASGNFSISVPVGSKSIEVSYIGFLSQIISIGNKTVINVSLENDAKQLSEVVVVGYGEQSKALITGSQVSIGAQEIKDAPLLSTEQALQGRAAGVQVTQASGTPGGGISVRIRGLSSLSGSNQPLYVVDGIPINTGSYTQLGAGGQLTNSLSDINPNDIESLEVLKDAAAAAIYGSRAANGVVLITTKRGKNETTQINFNSYYGTQSPRKKIPTLTGPEYITFLNEELKNRFGLDASAFGLDPNPANAKTTVWQDEIFQTAPQQNYDLSLRGGSDKTKFYVSGNYFNQDGIVIGSNYKRYSGKVNLDNQVSDKFKVGVSSYFSSSKSDRTNNDNNIYGVVSAAILLAPTIPVRNADGTYGKDPLSSIDNPVASALEPTFYATNTRLLANTFGEYTIIPSLKFKTTFGIDYLTSKDRRFYPTTTNVGAGANGSDAEGQNQEINFINENILTFNKTFGDHSLTVLGGITFQKSNFESLFGSATGFPGNDIKRLSAGAVKTDASSSGTSYGLVSYLSRLNYSYKNKYIVSGSVRIDGSSRFGANKRYGTFPAGSVAWRVTEENFMKNLKSVSNLKLRASYGITGNQEIGNFTSLALVAGGANYLQSPGLSPNQLGNPDLTWENATTLDFGLDLGLFKDRLNFTADYYDKKTDKLLQNRPLVGSSGFLSISKNLGSMDNKGLELALNGDIVRNKNLTWNLGANISIVKNKITKLEGAPFGAGFASWVQEGESVGSFRGYRVVGIFQSDAEVAAAPKQSNATRAGDIQFADLNGDGVITSADQEIIGQGLPKYYGGITTTLNYKGFDFSAFAQYIGGNSIYNNTRAFAEGMNSIFGQYATILNRWTPTNTNTNLPRAVFGDPNTNRRTSTRFLEDGSYLRMKNISLGYSFNKALVSKLKVRSLRLYVASQNLFTITKYSGFDPEVSTFSDTNLAPGTDFLTFPQGKTYTFGINLGF
ncbi:MAG: TonB-dependent receptor [Bacteroidetes bacterium]|nr:TonB-dependent receptor [Bacteroidota bacterium]MBU1372765.1 TonB-dependent receptor [Bacteroidota bacterium]MBU1484961.1 TonB-dependent receptor [Bacteroidota bacterium]MBU1760915.1 TonB-dependent receptor [Bacteroidota bacterium]MBU2266912.1 TonB-dependent receptor [Bacteroidota bacterium]